MFARLIPLALAACLSATAAIAQNAPPTRIRGTIAGLEGQTLSVNTREGTKVDVLLNDPLTVATVKKVDLADIKPNTYVGIATRTGANGELQALEVLVFPEAMRGVGEGYYAWDLEPGSMMTNGTVTGTVEAKSGRELSLSFKGSSNKIVVPAGVPIVTFAPAERADLKPGAPVMFGATKNAEGKLAAGRVTVGKDGVAPPM
ncbi:MAG TPA: hypothetical protein VGI78_25605 [Acetobacteraceae bacterium]